MKRKLANKDSLMNLQIKRLGKLEQENMKLKDENAKVKEESKKLKVELKQSAIELEEVSNGVVDLAELNLQAAMEQYKKDSEI